MNQLIEEQMQLQLEHVHSEMAALEAKCRHSNQRILKAIKSVRGEQFASDLDEIIKEGVYDFDYFELLRKPVGHAQEENYGLIKELWIDQGGGSITGDDFHGTICVQLKEKLFLKMWY